MIPRVAVLELTRRCPGRCLHCRNSPSDETLPDEVALRAASEMVELGVGTVVLTGGEPTLHPRWREVAARLARGGVKVRLFSRLGGEDPCVHEVAVSLEGPREIHETLRPGDSFEGVVAVLRGNRPVRVVTQVNRLTAPTLEATYALLLEFAPHRWQLHLTETAGRAKAHADLDPGLEEVRAALHVLDRASREGRIAAPVHCSFGWPNRAATCGAGRSLLTLGADGGVKGCPALPDTFAVARFPDRSLREIWEDDSCFPYSRAWSPTWLAGHCTDCPDAPLCRAGCPAVSWGATGSLGLNPFCTKGFTRRSR